MPVSNETRTLASPDPNCGIRADWYFARWYLKPVANNGKKDIEVETEPFPQPLAFDELNTLPGDTKVAAMHLRVVNPKSLKYRVIKVWRVGENSVRSNEILYEGSRINNILVVRGPLVPGKVVSLGVTISVIENHIDKPLLYAGDLQYRFEGQAPQELMAEAPAPPAPATAGAPAPATAGATAEDLKEQLQAALTNLRQAQLHKDINGLMNVYATAFPGYAQKRQEALEYWEGYNFDSLAFTVDKVQAIDSDHALAWVTWSQDVRDRKTQELSSGTRSLQLRFAKEEGNWRISDLQEAGAEAPAPPALATAGAPAPAPPAPAAPGATAEALKEQLQAALLTLRQAQLHQDINGLTSVYSTAFPGYAQKCKEALELWEGYDFTNLAFTVDKVQAIDSHHALAWVTWSQDVRDRKTQELSSGTQSLQLRFVKEKGNWRISDLHEARPGAPAPPALATAGAPAPAPPAPATAGAPAPAPPAPATAGAPAEDLKEQLQAALSNLRQAQLHKDINGLMNVYATAFPGYAQKRQEALEYWEGYNFDSLAFTVDKVQAIDSDHALAWVTWSQDVRDRKTQELSSGTRSLQLRFAKEEGNWRISDLQEAGAEAPAPPAPATAGAPAPAPPAPAAAGAPVEDLKEQLQAALSNLRQAQLHKDINGLMSVYSTAFPGYAQKRKEALEYWEGNNFDYLAFTVDKVQTIDSDHALAWVTWSQDVRDRKTQELSSGTQSLQLRFVKEKGNWRISDLHEARPGAPAPPALATAGAPAPAPPAPATAGAPAPAPPAPATAGAPAPATAGATAEDLKEQLQAALTNLRQAQLHKDINGLMSVYSTAFPGYAQKRKEALEYWEGNNFDYLTFTVDKVQAIDSDHALAWVTWSQDVRDRKTQELSSGTRSLQLRFAKEEGNWRISDLQEAGAEAPAPPAPATAGAPAPAPPAPAAAGAPAEDLKEQLQAALSNLRQAQLHKDINGLMSVYSTAFPGYAQKRQEALEYWEGNNFDYLTFTVDKVQAIDSDHALAWVTWSQDVRDRKTQELSSGTRSLQLRFAKEEGNWRISDLQEAGAEAPAPPAPAPPAPATAGPPAPAPPAPATAGAPAEDLKEQLQAALTTLRQAQLHKDINGLMSVYSTAFPGYAQKRQEALEYWEGYNFDYLVITVDKVQAIDSDHALAWVTWSQDVRNRKTQEFSSGIRNLQLRFAKEEGNWRISDLQEAGAEAPAPPALATVGAPAEDLKDQLQAALSTLRQAQLHKDINGLMNVYSTAFPIYYLRRQETLKYWEGYDFTNLVITVDKVRAIDSDHALAWVTCSQEVRNRKTRELSSGTQSLQLRFVKEKGNWRISDLQEAGAEAPAPPAPATAGPPAEDLKEQLQAALTNLRQAQLDQDINGLMSVYSTAFPGYAQKRKDVLKYWKGYKFDHLLITVDKVQAIDSDHALAWVTWSQNVRNRKTQEPSSDIKSLQLRFVKEEGNWRISDLQAGQ